MRSAGVVLAFVLTGFSASAQDVLLSNARFRLTIGEDAVAKSLTLKETGEELLDLHVRTPFFTVTQERPYNNEIKLIEPHVRTTYPANAVRREGKDLIIGFETAPYEAVVSVKEANDYIAFTLKDFRVGFEDYRLGALSTKTLAFTAPPAVEFRLAQLPVRSRANFGSWLNVVWDDRAAVALLGTSSEAIVTSRSTAGGQILSADAFKSVRLKGTGAALVADVGRESFLDRVDAFERDYGLPRGVANRRNPLTNASIYWTSDLCPSNVDEHVAMAKKGGFGLMLCYYSCFFSRTGDYPLKSEWPNGLSDVKAVLDKVRSAGIVPGLHVLHTYVATNSAYVAGGIADRRLGLKRHFTLSRPLGTDDTEVFVDEDPSEAEADPRIRWLRFGGEMMTYEGFTKERPYRFTGVTRGFAETTRKAHPCGEIGGLMDVSEYGGVDLYISQSADLQDIVADRFAELWRQGMGFVYFDGSEGVQPPFAYNVPNAQWRVWRKLNPAPFLGEGAAKAHFGWHMLSGSNAFDVFPPETFKSSIDAYPAREAPIMRKDMTRVNFGWWSVIPPGTTLPDGTISIGTQADMWEYGQARALGWDSPVTVQMRLDKLNAHPRRDDLLATMRRWEDVRMRKLLTAEQRRMLRDLKREFHLIEDDKGGCELVEWRQLDVAGGRWTPVRAFVYERKGRRGVVYWHVAGKAKLVLPDGLPTLEAEGMKQWDTDISERDLRRAFTKAVIR